MDAGFEATTIDEIFGGNAARFLGLSRGEANRDRLESYYRRHGLDSAKLAIFDRAV